MPKKEAVNKEPMVDIDTSGDSVDVELKDKDSKTTAKKEDETPKVEIQEEEVEEVKDEKKEEVPIALAEGKEADARSFLSKHITRPSADL